MRSLNKYKAAPGKAQTIYKAQFSYLYSYIFVKNRNLCTIDIEYNIAWKLNAKFLLRPNLFDK